jgi:hypothetical protein
MTLAERMIYGKGREEQERPEQRREEKKNRCDQHTLGSLFETGHPTCGTNPKRICSLTHCSSSPIRSMALTVWT